MTALQAVALYAGLNTILFIVLAANVSRHRRRAKVSLGIGTDKPLEAAFRAHGNAAENMPLGLLAIAILGFMGAGTLLIHALGLAFTLGRFAHAWGLLSRDGPSPGRLIGMALTWLSMLVAALALLWMAIS